MNSKNRSSISTIVIDNGGESVRIGNAGDEAPREIVPSIIGYSKFPSLEVAIDKCYYYIGEKAFAKRGLLNIGYPIKKRKIVDFDAMEKIWHAAMFEALKANPDEHAVLLTESCEYTAECRQKCAEIFFENFNVPSLYIGNQGSLGLFATGSTKGVVLDSGEGGTHVIPVFEGYVSPYSVISSPISGEAITDRLLKLLIEKGLTFSRHYDFDVIKKIKEQKCYISTDFEKEMLEFHEKANTKDILYELPDGQSINLNKEQIEAPELLFNPGSLVSAADGNEAMGIGELIYRSYFSIDTEIKKTLFDKIVLTGGNTLFPNIAERVSKSIRALGGNSVSFRLFCPAERKYSAWIGGSILACLTPFEAMWISKAEYEENGPDIINIKRI